MNDTEHNSACPSEMELSAYVDGALTEAAEVKVRAHLESCRECGRRTAGLLALGPLPVAELPLTPNGGCPDPQELGEHFEGKNSWGGRKRVEAHIARCPKCRNEFARYKLAGTAAEETRPSPEILSLVKGLVGSPEEPFARIPMYRPARPPAAVFPWVAAAVGIAALFIALFILLGGRDTGPAEAPPTAPRGPRAGHGTPGVEPGFPGTPADVRPPSDAPSAPTEVAETPSVPAEEPAGPAPAGPDPLPVEVLPVPGVPETPAPPAGSPGETPGPGEAVEAPPAETPGNPPVTVAETWERAEFQPVAIRGEEFGDLGPRSALVLGSHLPLPREGTPGVRVQEVKNGLLVDRDGDGKPETLVGKKGGSVRIRLAYAGGVPGSYLVAFTFEGDRWYYRGRTCMAGRVAGTTVFLFDENGNGRFNDPGVDVVAQETSSNFAHVAPIALLGEELHHLRIAESGAVVESKPYTGETGHLDVFTRFRGGDARVVTAIVCNDEVSVNATSLGYPVPMPVGRYRLHRGSVRTARTSADFEGSVDPVLEVRAGEVSRPHWGGPLTIEFEYAYGGDQITFRARDVHFTGMLGEEYFVEDASTARTRVSIRDAATFSVFKEVVASIPVSAAMAPGSRLGGGGG